MIFKKKALIHNVAEWDKVYNTTIGGDGFPCFYCGDFPVLVLEAENPNHHRDFSNKAYIFISASDIRDLLEQ